MRSACWSAVYRSYRHRYDVSPGFRFNGCGIQLYGPGRIELGEHSYIGELSTIQAATSRAVRVGRLCRISHNVRIYSETASADNDFRQGENDVISADVAIGDGVWIGANAFIGPGIAIGDNAVIGANSVLTRSVPADEIWAGIPARFVRRKRSRSAGDRSLP
ncbi:MAG: acyltransferase [Caldimonas sp.]